ncbi:MAG: cytochrome c3 family protein [Desulfobacterales bacterium]
MRPFNTKLCVAALILFFLATSTLGSDVHPTRYNPKSVSVLGTNIRSTKHNLSISGPGRITALSESQICIFCHIPHQQGPAARYLWNRSDPAYPYIPYFSSTLRADVGQPTGASRMCLSCHDGTIALGAINSSPTEIPLKNGIRFMPENSPSYLGTDLSDDHPISFVYDEMLALDNRQLWEPSALPPQVKLDENHELQCTACHDPHHNNYGQFLVMDNTASALCTACHNLPNWIGSSHAQSTALLDRTGGLWPTTDYATVAENGCGNCHAPHSARTKEWLLLFPFEEDNCLDCHDGRVASTDIAAEIAKPYRHAVQEYTGVHDPAEDFTFGRVPKHVECSDCHNPHQTNGDPSPGGGVVSGATTGVPGVSAAGYAATPAQYNYEICFKCHGDLNAYIISTPPVTRQLVELNLRYLFDPASPSFHPVEIQGKNPDVPSLLPPYTAASIINCTDCHGNNDPLGPLGPHGSDYQYILTDRYITADNTPESPSSYALCYQCHSRSILLSDLSFEHRFHVVDQKAPCSACHDPHGISATQGNSLRNSHLINFDVSIVSPTNTGRLEYNDLGRFRGQCFLRCHGFLHNPASYPK